MTILEEKARIEVETTPVVGLLTKAVVKGLREAGADGVLGRGRCGLVRFFKVITVLKSKPWVETTPSRT